MNRLTPLALIFGLSLGLAACSSASKSASTPAATPTAKATPAPAAPAATPAPQKADSSKLTCKKGKDERTIEIEAVSPKGCKLNYTKNGKTSAAASSKVSSKHCEDALEHLKKKLTDAKYECS